jgi:methionyl-tRNA synthetase
MQIMREQLTGAAGLIFTPTRQEVLDVCGGLSAGAARLSRSRSFHHRARDDLAHRRRRQPYVDEQAPWALRRSDPARMGTVLYVLAETLRHLAILTQPFVPDAAGKLLDQLAVPTEARSFADLAERLPAGRGLAGATGHFPALYRGRGRRRLSR